MRNHQLDGTKVKKAKKANMSYFWISMITIMALAAGIIGAVTAGAIRRRLSLARVPRP